MTFLSTDELSAFYSRMETKVEQARGVLGRPLILAEKILYSHLDGEVRTDYERGKSTLPLRPDRVAMQDATAQMALLQFMLTGRGKVAVPSTVHCDHLIQARVGAGEDLQAALGVNREVYRFLQSVSAKYGIGFWRPGSGIIHQVILENYAHPGAMMIGTDSHTPNAGGLGMLAMGVGGADASDVMAGETWGLTHPKFIGVHLTGRLSGWTAPKDVILKLAGILTVAGGTGKIVEYFGEGTRSISCSGKATITNMGAEIGATTSTFPFDERMGAYLRATERGHVADLCERHAGVLTADPEALTDPGEFYDEVIEIDLTTLEPHIVGPHSPDRARPISRLKADVEENGWPMEVGKALIGSCTNSSYQDLDRAASVAADGTARGLRPKAEFLVTPGSEQIHATIERDGQMRAFQEMGATILANACGPCIGQWRREDVEAGQPNSIITSYNRNFPKRNDGNVGTHAFIGSPEIVTAIAFAGTLAFNPLTDTLTTEDGKEVRLDPPEGAELPAEGFVRDISGYVAPPDDGSGVKIAIDPGSERLEVLSPFVAPKVPDDFRDLTLLVKAAGKCTTDHISPAGPWLKYRGHLTNISQNLFIGVQSAFQTENGKGLDVLSGERGVPLPDLAKRYKDAGKTWVIVGDTNYGEGSSREHAAMEPRYMGCKAVIARSFARIHETNLKRQGILPLRFARPEDYDRIQERDTLTIRGLDSLAPGKSLELEVRHEDASKETFEVTHTMTDQQIGWFHAGSALNEIRSRTSG